MKRMTNEEALDILVRQIECDNDSCPEPEMSCSECPYNVDAIDYARARKMAIEALSKQCASSEQADKSVIVDFVAFQREWLNSHKTLELDAVNNALVNIFLETTGKAFIDSLGQSAENDEDRTRDDEGPKLFGKRTIIEPGEEFIGEDLLKEALDQSADSDKMVDLKMRTITERLIIAESLINSVIADSDQFRDSAKKAEDVLINIPSAQPETNCSEMPNNSDLISRQDVIDAICAVCGNDCDKSEFVYNAPQDEQVILCPEHYCLCNLPSVQPERKTGRWIKTARWGRVYYCDQCRNYLDFDGVNAGRGSTNFCPNCGAKMLKEGE